MARIHRSREQWLQIIDDFQTSQLSIAAFCRQQQVSEGSFHRWRKLLRDSGALETEPLFVDITPPTEQPASALTPAWDIELTLGDGMVLRVRKPC